MYQDKDWHISDWCKLVSAGNRNWLYILVCKLVVLLSIPLRRSKQADHWSLDKHCLVHTVKANMGSLWRYLSSSQYDRVFWNGFQMCYKMKRYDSNVGKKIHWSIPWRIVHWTNAFPTIPLGQLHMGTWLYTKHSALTPHVPGQGSTHLFLKQALFWGQSVFSTHSGRQPTYGSPWYSDRHVQIPLSQRALGPQGDGVQGSATVGSAAKGTNLLYSRNFSIISDWAFYFNFLTWLNWSGVAVTERISRVSFEAGTYRNVIEYSALSIRSTRTWARVSAFCSHASLTRRTIWIHCTLWTTVWRTSNIRWSTLTRWPTINHTTFWIWTARRRQTWLCNFECCRRCSF